MSKAQIKIRTNTSLSIYPWKLIPRKINDFFYSTFVHSYNHKSGYWLKLLIYMYQARKGGKDLTPLSTIIQLNYGGQFYWCRKPEYQEKTTNLPQVTQPRKWSVMYMYLFVRGINFVSMIFQLWFFNCSDSACVFFNCFSSLPYSRIKIKVSENN